MRLLLPLIACVGLLGCLDPSLPGPGPRPTPPPDIAPDTNRHHSDAEFWSALADRVAAGRYPDTDRLLAVVIAAKEAGDVTNAARLETALPDAAANNQPLDTAATRAAVAAKIRSLK